MYKCIFLSSARVSPNICNFYVSKFVISIYNIVPVSKVLAQVIVPPLLCGYIQLCGQYSIIEKVFAEVIWE